MVDRTRRPMELFGEVMFEAPGQQDRTVDSPEDQSRGAELMGEVQPTIRQSGKERRREQRELEDQAPDLSEGWQRARDAEWIGNLAMQNRTFAPDPDYEQDPDRLLELTEGLPEEAIDYVAEGESAEETEWRAQRFRQDHENEQELGQMGLTGTALRVGAAMSDPVVWGASAGLSAVTGPLGVVGTAANRLNRVQRIVRGGAAGAAGNLAVEGAIRANKPIYDDMNLLYAAGLGFTIGGGVSALSRNPSTRPEVESLQRVGRNLQRDAEDGVRQVTDHAVNPQPAGSTGDAGAAVASREDPIRIDDVEAQDFVERAQKDPSVAPRSAYSSVRFDSTNVLKSSENPIMRAVGNTLAEDAVGSIDKGIASPFSATQQQLKRQRQVEIEWMRGWKGNFRRWAEERGGGTWKPWEKDRLEKQFSREITDYVEGVRDDVPESVRAQGDVMRKIFDDYRIDLNQPMAYRQEFGRPVKGFGTLEEDPFYVPREFDFQALGQLSREFGTPNLDDFFARAIQKGSDDLSWEQALRAGRAYQKTIRSLRVGIGNDAGRILSSGDAEEMKRFLRDNSDDLKEPEIEDIVDALTARKQSGASQHGKSRVAMDMSFEMDVRFNPEVKQGSRRLSIREFFNRDAHDLMMKYNRRMSGSLAMARMRVPGLTDGITSHGEFSTLKDRIRDAANMVGQDPKKLEQEIGELDFLYEAVMGIPLKANMTRTGQALRMARDYNFIRVMGQVGFAQFPEAAVAVAGLGLKASLKSVPGFRTMWRNAQNGELSNELAHEIESLTGIGGDWLRMSHVQRHDDVANTVDTPLGQSKTMDRIENFNREGKKAVFAGSGMSTINTFLQRFAMNGIVNRFADHAMGRGKLMSKQRLRSLGLSDVKVDRIMENIRTHAEWEDGIAGQRVKKLNLKDWDMTTSADFEEALFTYSRRLVQENDPGQMRAWMAHPVANTLLQFRSFIMGAHTKQLLHNIHMRDFQTFATFVGSSFVAALGYMAYTYSNSMGRSDRSEYLRERLSIPNVAKASFERSSWAALIPTGVDTAALPFTDPIFNYRTTGQSTDILFGNPSSDLVDSTTQAVGSLTKPFFEGRAPAQDEIRHGLRVLPFQNLHGITQMSNLLLGESGLPERAPQ